MAGMRRVCLQAPAKLNLHLGVYDERDERGYHRVDSLMVALDLADKVEVEGPLPGALEPEVLCDPPVDVPAHKNTAFRAAVALAERLGRVPNVRVRIRKHVPDQAGMGGSSSDAAAVLLALCELWGVDPASPAVVEAARSTGADVPFFLDPVPTLLVGAGDVVQEAFPPLSHAVSVALVRPQGPGVSTPVAYAAYDRDPIPPASPSALCHMLRQGTATPEDVAAHVHNNLDQVACALLPAVAEVRAWLLDQPGVLGGQVTGSGSCVFAICQDDAVAERVAVDARVRFGAWARACHLA